jgi:hypothetical protein
VPTYLVEAYAANRSGAVAEARERATHAAQLGVDVRYLRTTFVPQDETLLHVFEAMSADSLRRAVELAALAHDRIVEALEGAPPEVNGA